MMRELVFKSEKHGEVVVEYDTDVSLGFIEYLETLGEDGTFSVVEILSEIEKNCSVSSTPPLRELRAPDFMKLLNGIVNGIISDLVLESPALQQPETR